jgi:hypothetical protein
LTQIDAAVCVMYFAAMQRENLCRVFAKLVSSGAVLSSMFVDDY